MAKKQRFPILYMIKVSGYSAVPTGKTVELSKLNFNTIADSDSDEEEFHEWIEFQYEESAADCDYIMILNKEQLASLSKKLEKILK